MIQKRPRNILFIVNNLYVGGAQKHVVALLNGLGGTNCKFFLAVLKEPYLLLPQIDRECVDDLVFCNVGAKFSFKTIRLLADYLIKNDIDLVVCANQYPMLFGVIAAKLSKKKIPVIEIFHTTLLHKLKTKLMLVFYRWFFKQCDVVVFVSENQKAYWLNDKKLKVKLPCTIHNGVDTKHFDPALYENNQDIISKKIPFSKDDYIVGICAALRPEKYHSDLIEAVAIAQKEKCDAKLLIIGDGPMRKEIEAHIANRSIGDAAYITGFKEDVRPYIAQCACMVIASHSVETFSIAALESMAMGKPMIMSDIGGASEQVSHGFNGFLYPKGDIHQLAAHIQKLSDPDLQKTMGQRATQSVLDRFTITNMLQSYQRLFSKTK